MIPGIVVILVAGIQKEHFSGRGEIVGAVGRLGRLLHLAQGRQQHTCQDRDDGDDHQQFNQCELLQR